MACPKCHCKLTYSYYEDEWEADTDMERCAHCGYIFYIEEEEDDNDDLEEIWMN